MFAPYLGTLETNKYKAGYGLGGFAIISCEHNDAEFHLIQLGTKSGAPPQGINCAETA